MAARELWVVALLTDDVPCDCDGLVSSRKIHRDQAVVQGCIARVTVGSSKSNGLRSRATRESASALVLGFARQGQGGAFGASLSTVCEEKR